MTLKDEDKVQILLQLEKTATDQMMEIKKEEMSWLRIFLLFYSAVIAWSVQRWLGLNTPNYSELTMVRSVWLFAFISTIVFYVLFIRTRRSYYGVAKRLVRVQDLLHLYDSTTWNGTPPLLDVDKIGTVTGFCTWRKNTKPFNSFTTRIMYLFGANVIIAFVAYLGLKRIEPNTSLFFLVTRIILNIVILFLVMLCDFLSFYARRERYDGQDREISKQLQQTSDRCR